MAYNTFNTPPAADGTSVISTIDTTALITGLSDSYFNDASQIMSVMVQYDQSSGRQRKQLYHVGGSLQSDAVWSANADTGTWYKMKIIAFDTDGATSVLDRTDIGSGEDLIIS